MFAYIDAFEGGRQMTYQGVRDRLPHMVAGDEDMTASPGECVRRMLRNLISIGASRSNNMRDGSYSLLRCALELMMEVNTSDTMQYAFMLSRIYLQLNINQNEVRALLADQVNNPGLADQVKCSFIGIIDIIKFLLIKSPSSLSGGVLDASVPAPA